MKEVKNMECLAALAAVVPESVKATVNPDHSGVTVNFEYQFDENTRKPMVVTLDSLDAAYRGMVRMWPHMKIAKDAYADILKNKEIEQKKAAKGAKEKERQDGIAARKAERAKAKEEREKAKAEKKAAKDKERAEKLAAKEKAKADKLAAKEKAKADKAAADAKAKADKAAADAEKLKKAADAKAAQDAHPAAGTKSASATPPVIPSKDAGAKAVAAVKASSKKK